MGEFIMDDIVLWESKASESSVILEACEPFDARGMRPVYGRGDHFGRAPTYHMDIWRDRRGRLFMRFWSRSDEIDWQSFEVKGLDIGSIPEREREHCFVDCWLPQAVRDAYENWVLAWFPFTTT
jgi:hypothetical protein